jgi:alpha-beta hydrolase superfamily lysophospholipase
MGGMRATVHAAVAVALLLAGGCVSRFAYDERDLDAGTHPVSSSLLSQVRPHPTTAALARPVAVVTHGYSTTTWDTEPVAAALEARGVKVSRVCLGAHGTSIQDFEASDWHTWEAPIVAEYRALRAQGYRHVGVFGHSTGATLWLRALADGKLRVAPDQVVLLAPLIDFSPITGLIELVGVAPYLNVRGIERPVGGGSKGHTYRFRPMTTLRSLSELTAGLHRRLARGLALPAATKVLIIQGDADPVVSPRGARELASAIVGPHAEVMVVPTNLHNPAGPDGIQGHTFTPDEVKLRQRILDRIVAQF